MMTTKLALALLLAPSVSANTPECDCGTGDTVDLNIDFGSTGPKLNVNGIGKCLMADGTKWQNKMEDQTFSKLAHESPFQFATKAVEMIGQICQGKKIKLGVVLATAGNRYKNIDNKKGWKVLEDQFDASVIDTTSAVYGAISGTTEAYFEALLAGKGQEPPIAAPHWGIGGSSMQLTFSKADDWDVSEVHRIAVGPSDAAPTFTGCLASDDTDSCGAGAPCDFYDVYDGLHMFSFLGQLDVRTIKNTHVVGGMASSRLGYNHYCTGQDGKDAMNILEKGIDAEEFLAKSKACINRGLKTGMWYRFVKHFVKKIKTKFVPCGDLLLRAMSRTLSPVQ
jgi:hypothetical protein